MPRPSRFRVLAVWFGLCILAPGLVRAQATSSRALAPHVVVPQRRAVQARSGLNSINQDLKSIRQKTVDCVNPRNSFWDANLNRVEISTVQQVCDRALYFKSGRWVDSRVVDREPQSTPSRVIEFGSDEFFALAHRLAGEGRQGVIAVRGDILLVVDDEPVLVRGPAN